MCVCVCVCLCVWLHRALMSLCASLSLSLRCSGGVYSAAHTRGRGSSNLPSPACSPLSRSTSPPSQRCCSEQDQKFIPKLEELIQIGSFFFHKHCLRIFRENKHASMDYTNPGQTKGLGTLGRKKRDKER